MVIVEEMGKAAEDRSSQRRQLGARALPLTKSRTCGGDGKLRHLSSSVEPFVFITRDNREDAGIVKPPKKKISITRGNR